mmetsp:Transcript_107189/g.303141  ORF Transcript_107189/g.303141 Transcript_107189/m.303141 type:complete len:174 (-) Transcript_107189:213-734(-)
MSQLEGADLRLRPLYSARQAARSCGAADRPGQSPRSLANPLLTSYRSTARSRARDSALFGVPTEAAPGPRAACGAWGSAPDDEQRARRELERARQEGASWQRVGTTKFWASHGCGLGRFGHAPGPELGAAAVKAAPFATLQTYDSRACRLEQRAPSKRPSVCRGSLKPWEEPK